MGGATLASILHVTATHLHHIIVVPLFCPIAVIQLPSLIRRCIVIDILAIGGGGRIIAVTITVAIAISAIAIVAIIVNIALSTLLHHHRQNGGGQVSLVLILHIPL
jgi:hypothetical protein